VDTDDSPAYTAAFTLPADAACGTREVAATAEDSLGQTATATASLFVDCTTGAPKPPHKPHETPTPQPNPSPGPTPAVSPTVSLPANVQIAGRNGTVVGVSPTAAQGVAYAYVDFFLGARRVCRDTDAPYLCRIVVRSSDIGSQTLRVVVTDRAGLTGTDAQQVVVPRLTSRGLSLKVLRQRLSGSRVQRTVVAEVLPPKGVKRSTACADGWVAAVVSTGRVTLKDVQKDLDSRCRAVITRFTTRAGDSRTYTVSARFGGTAVMVPVSKTRRFS
jgi:hypothetical protein